MRNHAALGEDVFAHRKAEARLHIVEGLIIAIDNIDEVVAIIRGSKDSAEARTKLMKRLKLYSLRSAFLSLSPALLRQIQKPHVTSIWLT